MCVSLGMGNTVVFKFMMYNGIYETKYCLYEYTLFKLY